MRRALFRVFMVLAVLCAAASVFFYVKVRESNTLMAEFVETATRGVAPTDTEAVALALSREVFRRTSRGIPASQLPLYERLESTSFFNVTSSVSLKRGFYGVIGHEQFGPCGTMTRVMLVSLGRLGIPARKLYLLNDESGQWGGHTMLEFRSGGRWLVLSPSDSTFVWRTRDGRIATLDEIRADSTVFGAIFERFPHYPYRFGNPRHIRWEKLPAVARGFFRLVLGKKRFENAMTPRLYEHPRRLLLLASLSAFGFFGLGALLLGRSVGRRPADQGTRAA